MEHILVYRLPLDVAIYSWRVRYNLIQIQQQIHYTEFLTVYLNQAARTTELFGWIYSGRERKQ